MHTFKAGSARANALFTAAVGTMISCIALGNVASAGIRANASVVQQISSYKYDDNGRLLIVAVQRGRIQQAAYRVGLRNLSSASVASYRDYLDSLPAKLRSARDDVSPNRVVYVYRDTITKPIMTFSRKTIQSGLRTVVVDAQTGDVLEIRLDGTSD
jgi:hypothetical protein